MGKHFSYDKGNLYIFTTGGDEMLDLSVFPSRLNLFEAKSTWRISSWVIVADTVQKVTFDDAQIILQLNGYEHVNVPGNLLDSYFLDGEEAKILQSFTHTKKTRLEEAPLKEIYDA
jgi:hypothetical protein